eukprot:978107-Lingulodinium_polyedra.AAC.1
MEGTALRLLGDGDRTPEVRDSQTVLRCCDERRSAGVACVKGAGGAAYRTAWKWTRGGALR